MSTFAAKTRKVGRKKSPARPRTLVQGGKGTAHSGQPTFSRTLDEVIRDYSTTLRTLA